MKRIWTVALSLLSLMLLPTSAFAETVTQEDTGSEAPVIFYEHAVGNGMSFETTVPSSGATIPDVDNLVSNVFIGRDDIVVTLYEEPDFGGRSVTFEGAGLHNIYELGFNDLASSYEVAWKEDMAPVTFYEHVDGTGWAYTPGYHETETGETLAFPNDEMSSVMINDPNTVVVLYENFTAFEGATLTLDTVGLHDLEALGFNDIVSAYEIRAK